MLDKILDRFDANPRAVTGFALAITWLVLSGSAFLAVHLKQTVDGEIALAQRTIASIKDGAEQRVELVRERAQINSQKINELTATLVPLLKQQTAELKELKNEVGNLIKDSAAASAIYSKLSEIEMRTFVIASQLENQKLVSAHWVNAAVAAEVPFHGFYIADYLRRFSWSTATAAAVVLVPLLILIFRRKPRKP